MTTFYCPRCWQIIKDPHCCPDCGPCPPGGDVVDKYVAALRHSEPTRAMLAAHVLGEIMREPRAIEPLIALAETSPDPYLARSAIRGLGHQRDPRIAPALARRLQRPSTSVVVRLAIIEALAEIGGPETEPALRYALADDSPTVRALARRALDALMPAPHAQ